MGPPINGLDSKIATSSLFIHVHFYFEDAWERESKWTEDDTRTPSHILYILYLLHNSTRSTPRGLLSPHSRDSTHILQ